MAPLNIITVPARVLTKTARRIDPADADSVRELFGRMVETMADRGVGLAAPQVGESIRMFVALDPESHEIRGYVNPHITWTSDELVEAAEGCLSIPGVHAFVERHAAVRLRFQDLDFQEHEEEFSGWYARIVQHEFDHLNGVLISDRAVDGIMHPDKEEEEEASEGEADSDESAEADTM